MEWEQERHQLKRQLDAEQASRKFLEEEHEILQKDIQEKEKNIQHLTKLLKEQCEVVEKIDLKWKTKLETVEGEREEEEKKYVITINELKEQLCQIKLEQDNTNLASVSDVQNLKEKGDALEHDVANLRYEYDHLLQEKTQLTKLYGQVINEKEELNNLLCSTKEKLTSYMEHCNALQEEVVVLKMENNAIKSTPQPLSSKGNSVFAEVDDNRKALKSNLDKLSEKYSILKKEVKTKSLEITKLRTEKSSLLKRIQEISSMDDTFESSLVENYKRRIKELTSIIESLKREKEYSVTFNGDYRTIDKIFAVKNKEIETLQEQVEKLSQTIFLQNETVCSLRRDKQIQAHSAAVQVSEIMRLQEQLNAAKMNDEK